MRKTCTPVQDIFGDTPRNSLFLGVVHLYDCDCMIVATLRNVQTQAMHVVGDVSGREQGVSTVLYDAGAMMQVHVVKVPGFVKRSLSKWKIKI